MKPSELLCDESKWCQRAVALDESGNAVSPTDVMAIRWCLAGTIELCYGHYSMGYSEIKDIIKKNERLRFSYEF